MDKHYSEIYVHELEKEIAELKAEVERLTDLIDDLAKGRQGF